MTIHNMNVDYQGPRLNAFTLIELLVTISIIGLVAALVATATARAKGSALRIACTSNFKQFGIALQLYADDHNDCTLPNKDGQGIPLGETWVEGWLGVPGPDTKNTLFLKRSLLAPYIRDVTIWRCPASQTATQKGVAGPRVRTISLNGFVGESTNWPGATTYRKFSEMSRPGASELVTFVDERVDTINDGSFGLQKNFQSRKPQAWMLRDKPSTLHRGGANLAFGDGHVETHFWRDQRTKAAPRDDTIMPDNEDIHWMQQHCTWREE